MMTLDTVGCSLLGYGLITEVLHSAVELVVGVCHRPVPGK